MDKLDNYRSSIKSLLNRYAEADVVSQSVEVQLIFDEMRDHYQWMNLGWQGSKPVYRCIVHFNIRDGKVWLQQNLTDQNPAEELVEMGVNRQDIVLGLQPPYKRPYTSYGGGLNLGGDC